MKYENKLKEQKATIKNVEWDGVIRQLSTKIVISINGRIGTALLRDTSESKNEWIIDKYISIFKGDVQNILIDQCLQ